MLSLRTRQCMTWMWSEEGKEREGDTLAQRRCKEKWNVVIQHFHLQKSFLVAPNLPVLNSSLQASPRPCLLTSPWVCNTTNTVADRPCIPACRVWAQRWAFFVLDSILRSNIRAHGSAWLDELRRPKPFSSLMNRIFGSWISQKMPWKSH